MGGRVRSRESSPSVTQLVWHSQWRLHDERATSKVNAIDSCSFEAIRPPAPSRRTAYVVRWACVARDSFAQRLSERYSKSRKATINNKQLSADGLSKPQTAGQMYRQGTYAPTHLDCLFACLLMCCVALLWEHHTQHGFCCASAVSVVFSFRPFGNEVIFRACVPTAQLKQRNSLAV